MTARYCKGVFTDTYKKTIGVDFLEKTIESGLPAGESVKLLIWDTAGQEEFDALTASYYRGAGACAIVFSSTDRASFEAVERWKRKVEAEFEGRAAPVLALVQNKADLLEAAPGAGGGAGAGQMSAAEVEALAARLGLPLFLTSVKRDSNVREVFESLAVRCILRDKPAPPPAPAAAAAAAAMAPTPAQQQQQQQASAAPAGAGAAVSVSSAPTAVAEVPAAAGAAFSSGSASASAAASIGAAGASAGPTPTPLAQQPASLAAAPPATAAASTIKLGSAADDKAARKRPKKAFSFC